MHPARPKSNVSSIPLPFVLPPSSFNTLRMSQVSCCHIYHGLSASLSSFIEILGLLRTYTCDVLFKSFTSKTLHRTYTAFSIHTHCSYKNSPAAHVTPKDFAKPPEVWLSTLSMDFCVIFIHFKLPVDFPNGCQRCKDLKEQTKYLAFGLDFVLQVYGLHCVNSLV